MDERASGSKSVPKGNNNRRNKRNSANNKNHQFKKRPPFKPESGKNVIYISNKTHPNAIIEKCSKLINNDEKEIILYCLGAAIQRGIIISLKLCEKYPTYQLETKTFTVELTDDLIPTVDEEDYEIQRRHNSALRFRFFTTENLTTSTPTPSSKN